MTQRAFAYRAQDGSLVPGIVGIASTNSTQNLATTQFVQDAITNKFKVFNNVDPTAGDGVNGDFWITYQ